MQKPMHDVGRARRWRVVRRKIRTADPDERYKLLRYFGNEIRVLTPLAAQESAEVWDINAATEIMSGQGTLIGGCWQADPANPSWPGRDRLFLGGREDLLSACCCLSLLGFFPHEQVAPIVDSALAAGSTAVVPGIEAPGAATEEIALLAWESAIESGRSKRRWRDYLGTEAGKEWAASAWREPPAVWRTFVMIDSLSPAARDLREFPVRGGEPPAGFVAILTVQRSDAASLATDWRTAGWDTTVVSRSDCLGLYDALASAHDGNPTAIMLAIGQTSSSLSSRTTRRTKEPTLLGELSDEQFHAIMGESIQF